MGTDRGVFDPRRRLRYRDDWGFLGAAGDIQCGNNDLDDPDGDGHDVRVRDNDGYTDLKRRNEQQWGVNVFP